MKKKLNKYIPLALGAYINGMAVFTKKRMVEKAFRLFCTPRRGRILPDQKSFLEDAKDDILIVSDTSIQTYRWQGNNTTVLLMHGWESNSFRWRNMIPVLQKEGYNIVAFDAPAHGNTSGKLLNVPLYSSCAQAIIKKYQPRYIIGHSLGGMTMLYNQYKYPNTAIEKLVALGAPSELSDFMKQFQGLLGLSTRVMSGLEDYFMERFGYHFADFSSPKFARDIPAKGLLIHDELDAVAPIYCSEQVHANWKNSTFIRTKGLGHSLHQDKVRDQIVAFLKSQ